MFSVTKYRLVKALHESDCGYTNSGFGEYDNVIGECYEKFFVNGCLYENKEIDIPCFGCQVYYRTPEKYYLTRGVDKHDNKTIGYRVVDKHGFGFWHVHSTKEEAIAEACETFDTLEIHIYDMTCDVCQNCGCC